MAIVWFMKSKKAIIFLSEFLYNHSFSCNSIESIHCINYRKSSFIMAITISYRKIISQSSSFREFSQSQTLHGTGDVSRAWLDHDHSSFTSQHFNVSRVKCHTNLQEEFQGKYVVKIMQQLFPKSSGLRTWCEGFTITQI